MKVARFHHYSKCMSLFGLAILLSLGLGVAALAAQDPLYTATSLVKTQSESERNRAASETLGEVVVRASGRSDAAMHPLVIAAQANAINYLFGFSYSDYNATLTEGEAENQTQVPAMTLSLNYSQEAIAKLLRSAELPVWPNPRPKLLVWVVAEGATGLDAQAAPELVAQFKQVAGLRGLPITFATQDIEDQLAVTAEDLWRVNTRQIEMASLRYKADAVLLVRMAPVTAAPIPAAATAEELAQGWETSSSEASSSVSSVMSESSAAVSSDAPPEPVVVEPWQLQWQLISQTEQPSTALVVQNFAQMAAQVVNPLADSLAQRYAIGGGAAQAGAYYLHILGVNDFRAFKRAQDYLQGLEVFSAVTTVKSDAQSLLVKVETEGDLRLLLSTLSLGDRLQSMSDVQALLNPQSVAPPEDASPLLPQSEDELAQALAAEFEQSLASPDGLPTAPIQAEAATPVAELGTVENPLVYQWLR